MQVRWTVQNWVLWAVILISTTVHATENGVFSNASNTSSFSTSADDDSGFLDPEVAFQFTTQESAQTLSWQWTIEPGYYLYKKRFAVTTTDGQSLTEFTLSDGTVSVEDPDFGKVDVYYGSAELTLSKSNIPAGVNRVKVQYQGCAEAGLCYPPQFTELTFTPLGGTQAPSKSTSPISETGQWQQYFSEASFTTLIFLFFVGGLLLTFTPCVLPMIPILSTIVLGDAQSGRQPSAARGFLLSLSYVLGMALTFAGAGLLAGILGAQFNLQIYMQSPWVLIPFIIVFIALALAMFGFYELQLPAVLRDRLTQTSADLKGGKLLSVFGIGALSALVVSPCVSAPLAGALAYISTTGDATLGGIGLLALGLGMGTPLLIIGTTGAKVFPKAGAWMEKVKIFFGVLLLGVALVLLERIISPSFGLVLWSLLLGLYGVHLGAFEAAVTGWQKTFKGIGLFLVLYAVLLFIGAAQGHKAMWPPLPTHPTTTLTDPSQQTGSTHDQAIVITSQAELQDYLDKAQSEHKLVMVDLYADWCIACKEMENKVLHTPEVSNRLSKLYWLKLDMTTFNEDHKAFLGQYQLFGPPAFLFFGFDGKEIPEARIVGEVSKKTFLSHLDQFEL